MDFLPMHAWHPMIVHFPLGLLLGGAVVEVAGWVARRPSLRRAGLVLLTTGVLFAIPAIATGLLAYNRVDHSDAGHVMMVLHRNLMLLAVGLFTLVVAWRWLAGERVSPTRLGATVYGSLLAAAALTLVVGADRGATMVYRHAMGLPSERLEAVLHERGRGRAHTHAAAGAGGANPAQDASPGPGGEGQAGGRPADAEQPPAHDDAGAPPHSH